MDFAHLPDVYIYIYIHIFNALWLKSTVLYLVSKWEIQFWHIAFSLLTDSDRQKIIHFVGD